MNILYIMPYEDKKQILKNYDNIVHTIRTTNINQKSNEKSNEYHSNNHTVNTYYEYNTYNSNNTKRY